MPTLPALTSLVRSTTRSYCMCVCAVKTIRSSTPARNSRTRSSGVRTVTHSSSPRGEPCVKRIAPSTSCCTRTAASKAVTNATASGPCCSRSHAPRSPSSSPSARSALPRTNAVRPRHGSSSASVSRGSGPHVRSPHETSSSAPSRSASASTASSAGAFPCTSAMTATHAANGSISREALDDQLLVGQTETADELLHPVDHPGRPGDDVRERSEVIAEVGAQEALVDPTPLARPLRIGRHRRNHRQPGDPRLELRQLVEPGGRRAVAARVQQRDAIRQRAISDKAKHGAEDGNPNPARDEDVLGCRVIREREVPPRLLDLDRSADLELGEAALERGVA